MKYTIVVDIIPDAGGEDDVTHRIERREVTLDMLRDSGWMDKEFNMLGRMARRVCKPASEEIAEARAAFERLTGQPSPA